MYFLSSYHSLEYSTGNIHVCLFADYITDVSDKQEQDHNGSDEDGMLSDPSPQCRPEETMDV